MIQEDMNQRKSRVFANGPGDRGSIPTRVIPTFVRPCEEVHRSTSLMSSTLLPQKCPACLVRLIWIVFVMATAAVLWSVASRTCSIQFVAFLSNCREDFFSIRLVSVRVVHPYSSIDTTAAWKKLHLILLDRSDIHKTESLLRAVHAFASHVSISFMVDEVGELVH